MYNLTKRKRVVMSIDVFLASELSTRRRDFIDAGRAGEAVMRDADGTLLILTPFRDFQTTKEIIKTTFELMRTEASFERQDVRPSDIPFSWLTEFDHEDRSEFFSEMRDALSTAESTHDFSGVKKCLDAWKLTSHALSDATRRVILTGDGEGEYFEISRPEPLPSESA